jgi:hypothetical protein
MVYGDKSDAENKTGNHRADRKTAAEVAILACAEGDRRGGDKRQKENYPGQRYHPVTISSR